MTSEPKLPGAKRPWMRPLLSGLAILLCGVLIGGALTSMLLWDRLSHQMRHPRLDPLRASMRISEKYDLDEDTRLQLREILDAHIAEFEKIRQRATPTLDSLSIDFRDQVAEILSPEQSEEWLTEFDDHMRRFKKRFHGPFKEAPPEPAPPPPEPPRR